VRVAEFPISDGFISPLDLVTIELKSVGEPQTHHQLETARAAVDIWRGDPTTNGGMSMFGARRVARRTARRTARRRA
jgi:hypothetical protein